MNGTNVIAVIAIISLIFNAYQKSKIDIQLKLIRKYDFFNKRLQFMNESIIKVLKGEITEDEALQMIAEQDSKNKKQ